MIENKEEFELEKYYGYVYACEKCSVMFGSDLSLKVKICPKCSKREKMNTIKQQGEKHKDG